MNPLVWLVAGFLAGNPDARKKVENTFAGFMNNFARRYEKKEVVRNDRTSENVAEVSTPSNITSTAPFEQPKPE